MKIKQIDVLVHPDFVQMDEPGQPLHPRQKELRTKWDERVKALKSQSEAILLYFSNIPEDELDNLIKGEPADEEIKRFDVERIKRYRKILGERLYIFGKEENPDGDELKKLLASRNFEIEPSETKVLAYGETFEACVTAWGHHVKTGLEIPDKNYDFYTEGMSLTFEDGNEIAEWRNKRREGLSRFWRV